FRHGHLFGGAEVEPSEVAAALPPALPARVLDEDTTHGLGRSGKEVAAALPVALLGVANKAEIRLVNEGRGLEGVPGRLVGQAMAGQLPQLVVNERQELAGGTRVAACDGAQDLRDLAHWPHHISLHGAFVPFYQIARPLTRRPCVLCV